jgi:hypothetical protein
MIRKLLRSDIEQLGAFLTGRKNPILRPVHNLLGDTYTIVQRSDQCVVVELRQVVRIEQIAWMGILGTKNPNHFGVHNKFVNTSLFSSSEHQI